MERRPGSADGSDAEGRRFVKLAKRYGPWALIAGGSGGIGLAIAEQFAADGLNLLLLARDPDTLDRAARNIRAEHGVEVQTLAVDLAMAGALQKVQSAADGLEIGMLVYLAGATPPALFCDQSMADIERTTALNLTVPLALCRHFVPAMRARGRGGVVLGASVAALAGTYGLSVYAGCKAAQMNFGESLWHEMRPAGVDVLTVLIGATRTPTVARLGIDYDSIPSLVAMDSAAVARVTLDRLLAGDGPVVWASAHDESDAGQYCTPDRRKAAERMSAATYRMMNPE